MNHLDECESWNDGWFINKIMSSISGQGILGNGTQGEGRAVGTYEDEGIKLLQGMCQHLPCEHEIYLKCMSGIEFKDFKFNLGFRQSTFLCATLKCIEFFHYDMGFHPLNL